MGQTLTNGIYLPNEGERNCYSGLAANWNAVDTLKGNYSLHAINVDIHVTAAEKETWNGKADNSALTAHTGDTTIHVTSADKQAWDGHVADTTIHVTSADKQAWNGKADNSALTAHTGDTTIHVTSADKQAWDGHVADTTIHVTSADKQAWNGKADNSALTAHTGDTTIHVTSADKQAWDGHVADSVKHVTAEDKNKWDAVSSKANDSDVVHKSGDETISGNKTFSSINGVEPSSLGMPDLSNGIDISSYITLPNTHNTYTPPVNGWISVVLKSTAGAIGVFLYQGDLSSANYSSTSLPNESEPCVMCCLPVVENTAVSIDTKGSRAYVVSAKFYPCQGNV